MKGVLVARLSQCNLQASLWTRSRRLLKRNKVWRKETDIAKMGSSEAECFLCLLSFVEKRVLGPELGSGRVVKKEKKKQNPSQVYRSLPKAKGFQLPNVLALFSFLMHLLLLLEIFQTTDGQPLCSLSAFVSFNSLCALSISPETMDDSTSLGTIFEQRPVEACRRPYGEGQLAVILYDRKGRLISLFRLMPHRIGCKSHTSTSEQDSNFIC